MKRERYRWEVLPGGGLLLRWHVTRKAKIVGRYPFQFLAINSAVAGCKFELAQHKQPSELVIKGTDGRIRDSRTYGDDPKGTKG